MLKLQINIIINNTGQVLQFVGTTPKLSLQFQCSHELEELQIDRSIKQRHKAINTHSG